MSSPAETDLPAIDVLKIQQKEHKLFDILTDYDEFKKRPYILDILTD